MRILNTILYAMGLLAVLAAGSIRLDAQTRNRLDNRGREFWLAFLQTNGAEDTPRLALTLWAERAGTTVTVTYARTGRTTTITLSQANTAYHFDLSTDELLLPSPRILDVTRSALHVVASSEVSLYGVNMMIWSSDSFVGLPTDLLGTRHFVMSYPNTLASDLQGEFTGASDFPSQFAVVAGQDGTNVDVYPTTRVNGRADANPFTVTMNAGDVFFAQADGKAGVDLTGSEIRSNKPVTVFGSHQRTNIPWNQAVGRDHLVEQLPPVNRWPWRVMVIPHYQIPKTKNDPNIYRIIAANDNTTISLDSVPYGTLNARQVLELPLDRAHLITASGPILVAEFHASVSDHPYVRVPNDSIGDPFMALVQAPEQYDTLYSFESYSSKDFIFHYINVTIPTERVNTLQFDGSPLNVAFTRIEKTSYSYAQIPVIAGAHRIRAAVPFGLMIYGYGPYNSYGAPGAFVFDTLYKDQSRPDIRWRDSCGGAVGAALDIGFGDRGMDTLKLRETSRNVRLVLSPYVKGADSIPFQLELVDPYQDGWADLIAVDSVGLDRYYSFPVKGFTLAISGGSGEGAVELDTLASLNGKEFCRKVTVRNYGSFPQDVTTLLTDPVSPDVTVAGGLPATLQPGEERTFDVCYRHEGDTSAVYLLSIGNDCRLRTVARLPVISGVDSVPPVITPNNDPCRENDAVHLTDLGVLNAGVDSVIVRQLVNADTVITPSLPGKSVDVQIRRRDPYQDMMYSLVIKDAVGNASYLSDSVAGFTLAVMRQTGQQLGVRFDAPWDFQEMTYGEMACDTVYLHNYGIFPLDLTSLHMQGNMQFSIPPEQLPITLGVGETRALAVCVVPRGSGDRVDTLLAEFFCGALVEKVPVHTVVKPLSVGSNAGCTSIVFNIGGFLRRSFVSAPVPNPVAGASASITIGVAEAGNVTLAIYDDKGNEVRRVLDGVSMPNGLAQVEADVHDLPSGSYFIRMQTSAGMQPAERLVISR